MPPRLYSRYTFVTAALDEKGRLALSEREPYRFQAFADNRFHLVVDGDTLFNLADRYFGPRTDAASLWWIIAEFQPEPILDPTLSLEPGRQLVIPSLRTIEGEIFSERRRAET